MFEEIVRDWEHWIGSPRGRRRLAAWAGDHPALACWSQPELGSPPASPRTDAMQAALVARAQGGDEDAVRTLIVQLRPGLACVVWRAQRRRLAGAAPFGSLAEAQSEVLSAFGETLTRHRLDRRPERIAANLLLDTHQRLWREDQREDRARLRPWAGPPAPEPLAASPIEPVDGVLDLVAAVASALDQLTGTPGSRRLTAEAAYRAWILDEPSVLIARELGLERKALDTRLCRLRRAVRQAAPPERSAEPTAQDGLSLSEGSAPLSSPVGPSLVSRQ
jgi:hypothetical protein